MKRAPVEGDDRQQIVFVLSDVIRLLRADFAGRARHLALTPPLHRLLFYVQRNPGCHQVDIAAWLDVKPVTVGRMIDRLEKQRVVRRESDPGDRRAFRVHLDDPAGPLVVQLKALAASGRERAFHGLSPREREALLLALARVRDKLSTDAARSTRSARSPRRLRCR